MMSLAPAYKNLIIYYFSGTGNALNAANWLSQMAAEFNINSQIISIDRFKKISPPVLNGKTLFTFCYPTHGFNPAPLMLNFIFKFPKGKSNFVLINTRGGLKFKKIFFPGFSGLAQLLPILILFLKGYKLAGSLPFDLPSNWISAHPGLSDNAINQIVQRRKLQLFKFAEKLFSKGKSFNYKFFLYFPLDIALTPITLGYYFCGRYIFAKSFYASADCNDCRLCVESCPTESVIILGNRPFWKYSCESCMRCISICPNKSIQTAHSFVIPTLYLNSLIPVAAAIFNLWGLNLQSGFLGNVAFTIINWLLTFSVMVIAYKIFSLLIKIKFINKFFEYTSLTRYWRRYLAPGTSPKSFKQSKST